MKRKLTIIITLMAIALLSVEASAQKFVFNFTEYDFCISGSELGTSQHAKSVVTINKKTSKETGEDYSIVITSEALVPSIYDNVKLVDYIDADGLIEIVFAITGTHYLLVCLSLEEQYGAILELNPENTDDDVASYSNDIDDNAGQAAFLKEFDRLNDFVTANYEIDKNKSKTPDVIVTPVIPVSKKTETKPIIPVATSGTSYATKIRRLTLSQLLTHIADYGEFGLPIRTIYQNMTSAGLKTRYEEDKSVFAAFCSQNCGMANHLKNDIELYIDGLSHQYTQSSVTYGSNDQGKKTLLYMFWFENSPGSTREADAFLKSLIAEINKLGYDFDPIKIDSTQSSHADKYKNVTIWRTSYADQKDQLIYGGALYVFE